MKPENKELLKSFDKHTCKRVLDRTTSRRIKKLENAKICGGTLIEISNRNFSFEQFLHFPYICDKCGTWTTDIYE